MGHAVELRVEEETTRSIREPTSAEKSRQQRDSWFKPDLTVHAPNGRLKLSLWGANKYNPLVTVTCAPDTPLEEKLGTVVPRLWERLAKSRIDDQIQEEERERWRQEWARKQALEETRQAEIERLKQTQKLAKQWKRASRLREYADALERVGHGPTGASTDQTLQSELAWIRKAADWIDPLVQAHWPEVDGDDKSDDETLRR
jgi:hypothetical protein